MIAFGTEWLEPHGVRDELLAATWCSLAIRIDGHDIIQAYTDASKTVRSVVFGSALPLVEWVVENWWFLLSEPWRAPNDPAVRSFSSRETAARHSSAIPWLKRHSFLAAREGMSLPDLVLFRDGDGIGIQWTPDPPALESTRPVRFIASGYHRDELSVVEKALRELVESVADRVSGVVDPNKLPWYEEWLNIQAAESDDKKRWSALAAVGIDPFDPSPAVDKLEAQVEKLVVDLGATLAEDLFFATTVRDFDDDARFARAAVHSAHYTRASRPPIVTHTTTTSIAHLAGYERARWLRDTHRVPGNLKGRDVFSDIAEKFSANSRRSRVPKCENIRAAIGSVGDVLLIAAPDMPPLATNFNGARAIHHWLFEQGAIFPRLVTNSRAWDQRASRSFAAELLAPADEIRATISKPEIRNDELEQIADLFGVQPALIRHQIDNHDIAWVMD